MFSFLWVLVALMSTALLLHAYRRHRVSRRTGTATPWYEVGNVAEAGSMTAMALSQVAGWSTVPGMVLMDVALVLLVVGVVTSVDAKNRQGR